MYYVVFSTCFLTDDHYLDLVRRSERYVLAFLMEKIWSALEQVDSSSGALATQRARPMIAAREVLLLTYPGRGRISASRR